MSNANVALVQGMYAAFGRGEVQTIADGCAAQVDWSNVGRSSDFPTLGQRKGRAAVKEFFGTVAANMDFSEFSPKEFHPVGDKVFVLGSYAATVKKTGKPFRSDWIHIFTVQGGKVATFREFTDTAQAAEAYRG